MRKEVQLVWNLMAFVEYNGAEYHKRCRENEYGEERSGYIDFDCFQPGPSTAQIVAARIERGESGLGGVSENGLFLKYSPLLFPQETKIPDIRWQAASDDSDVGNDFDPGGFFCDIRIGRVYPLFVCRYCGD